MRQLITIEPWHLVGAPGEPPFENGWSNWTSHQPAAFAKDSLGFVHLKGEIKDGGLGLAAFTLPPGYRPSSSGPGQTMPAGSFTSMGAPQAALLYIDSLFRVRPYAPTNHEIGFTGISFKAEQ